MNRIRKHIKTVFGLVSLCSIFMSNVYGADATCHGEFANPITDICWSCTLPLTIGGDAEMISMDQEDIDNPNGVFCHCDGTLRVGLNIGFWEPVRMVDITRTPFCMVGLGGTDISPGFDIHEGGLGSANEGSNYSFYHAHWYVNPILYWLEVLLDNPCLESGDFDVVSLSELDPTWNDEELTHILSPDAAAFTTKLAHAACAVDCISANLDFGRPELYWCAGCSGTLFPLTGYVQAHMGGVQSSELLLQRLAAKQHRELITMSAAGNDGMCGYYFDPVMDKTHYKAQLTYPIPRTEKINGRCCSPFGRSTAIWGAGKEYPYEGEHFSYQVWRKRNCCMGAIGLDGLGY